ncbi:MAG: phosphatidate cytidylyltransferase [Nitrospirae bacterium]|nr:phosphatidate cytidylyltransferase [Nitrospirota bacterium]
MAALVLPFIIAYLYYLPPMPYFIALLIAVAMFAMWEFFVMYKVPAKMYVPGIVSGGILLFLFCRFPEYFVNGVFVVLFLLLFFRLFFMSTPAGCMRDVGPVWMGIFYIAGFLSFQWLLRIGQFGREYIFLLYTSVWISDSMAYYIGTYLGRNKLYPAISPNKTIEGAFGSVLGGILGIVIIKTIFGLSMLSAAAVIAIGAAMGISSLVGDLIESMFKRDAGVKDSSHLIPAHGGLLDKLDGILVSGPVLYLIVRYF